MQSINMVKIFTLPNGCQVVTYYIPQVKSVHINVAVKGGSLVEKKEKNGVAHFMEHMLVQGIPSFPTVEKLSTYIEGLAGSYNAYTSQLTVAFSLTVPFIHLESAIKIASEVIFAPLFPEEALERERKAVISEITQRKDSLGYKLGKAFKSYRYNKDSILHQEVGGSLEAVQALQREDLVNYWKTYFLPKNTFIYIGGNFTEKELQKFLLLYFGKYTQENKFAGFPRLFSGDFVERQVFLKEDKLLGTNYVTFSFPGLKLEDDWKKTAQQDIALTILGQLRTSRLFKLLRYQKGLVYNVYAQRALIPGLGYIDIGSEVNLEHLEEVISIITETLHTYIHQGPTEEELQFVKNYYINSWLMAFDSPASVASWLEEEMLWEEKIRMPEDYIAMVKTITKEDIIAVMQKEWDFKKLQLLIQGPVQASSENKAKFAAIVQKLI